MILIVSGPGGVGKGTVVARLLELEDGLTLSRSWTTRTRRPGEADDAYVFVDRETFKQRISDGGFLEWTEFPGNGRLYGTPTIDAGDLASSEAVVLEIELHGARQVKASHPDAVLVLIVAPSVEAQVARMRGRGDDEDAVRRRVAVGAEEERTGRRIADYVVVNDDVDRAAHEVAAILAGHRAGR